MNILPIQSCLCKRLKFMLFSSTNTTARERESEGRRDKVGKLSPLLVVNKRRRKRTSIELRARCYLSAFETLKIKLMFLLSFKDLHSRERECCQWLSKRSLFMSLSKKEQTLLIDDWGIIFSKIDNIIISFNIDSFSFCCYQNEFSFDWYEWEQSWCMSSSEEIIRKNERNAWIPDSLWHMSNINQSDMYIVEYIHSSYFLAFAFPFLKECWWWWFIEENLFQFHILRFFY